jgi:hypothetical protein
MDINAAADFYAYSMCGSSPCEDCDEFRHIISKKEKNEFIECMFASKCDDAKEYDLIMSARPVQYM